MSIALPRLRRRKLNREPIGIYVFLTLLGVIMFLPLYLMVITAFKPLEELFLFPPRYYVMNPTLNSFTDLLIATDAAWVPFSRYLFNSLFVTGATVVLYVIVCSLCAYPLSKSKAPGMAGFFTLCIAALMFAPEVTNIPRYLVVNGLGWIDTYWALIIPALAGSYGVFLMRQFLDQVPDTLLEAARIDGASELRVFWSVIMPLARPAWASLTIFSWIGTWNDEFAPLIFARTEAMKTLPLAIHTLFSGAQVVARQNAAAAAGLLQLLPTLIIFVLLQKRVIETMAHSGIKS